MFSVSTGSLDDLLSRLEQAKVMLVPLVSVAILQASEDAVSFLHDDCPVDMEADNVQIPGEEGHLQDSFLADPVQESETGASAQVRTQEPIKYSYVTLGTIDKEPIEPVSKKRLWWPGAPHPLLQVHGQQANPFAETIPGEVAAKGYVYFKPLIDMLSETL